MIESLLSLSIFLMLSGNDTSFGHSSIIMEARDAKFPNQSDSDVNGSLNIDRCWSDVRCCNAYGRHVILGSTARSRLVRLWRHLIPSGISTNSAQARSLRTCRVVRFESHLTGKLVSVSKRSMSNDVRDIRPCNPSSGTDFSLPLHRVRDLRLMRVSRTSLGTGIMFSSNKTVSFVRLSSL